jgi:hypothetical protein
VARLERREIHSICVIVLFNKAYDALGMLSAAMASFACYFIAKL